MNYISHIKSEGYIILQNIIKKDQIKVIFSTLEKAKNSYLLKKSAQVNHENNCINTIYKSSNCPGLSYCYLMTKEIKKISDSISRKLESITKVSWKSNGNFLPIFEYGENTTLKPHRDWDIGFGPISFIAIAILTKPRIDFNGGRLFINKEARVSNDGKKLYAENTKKRKYLYGNIGDIIIIENKNQIHGVESVLPGSERTCRVTVSWRA